MTEEELNTIAHQTLSELGIAYTGPTPVQVLAAEALRLNQLLHAIAMREPKAT